MGTRRTRRVAACGIVSHDTGRRLGPCRALAWLGLSLALVVGPSRLLAEGIVSSPRTDPLAATESAAARQSAIQSIPIEKLDEAARKKVAATLSSVTVFRRLPTRVTACDPDLYLFLVRHPDVVVNIWEVLGITQLQLRQTAPNVYRVVESDGCSAVIEFLYQSHDTHIIYSDWSYTGSLLPRPIHGRCLAVLKTGYVRETDGRCYITNRLDGFLSVEPGAAELLTRTLHPLVMKNADANFIQTVAFVGSLSRTAEVNNRGLQRLVTKLAHVTPQLRQQLAELSASISEKAAALTEHASTSDSARVASRPLETER
jgi:hypothetical protein